MKILAIRGKNLASLSTEFVVDFQSEPLASAGLYAITGPTGSGKSTLLDALCLALYEKTPRLTGVGRSGDIPDVGDNGITPGDVRTILRRGAAEGFAEVDFVGSDGIAYRSRWSVRRSYSKTNGKMQNSEISLMRILDGQQLGDHRKTETLRLIESCIGLSFDQFTRAVLLAQNDFSAFLKASDDDRAELLQTLTGTEAFSAISIQAFERMKAEKEQLNRLQVQLKDQEPLAPETRAEKESQLQTQSDSAQTLVQQKSVIESHLRWYQLWNQFKAAESDASQKLESATSNKNAAAPRYEHLALVDRVQSSRPLWSELVRLNQAVVTTVKAEELVKAALATSQGEVNIRQTEHDAALHQQAIAETVRTEAQSDIDTAKALDASIVTISPQFEAAVKAQKAATDHLQAEQSRQADANGRMGTAKADLATAQQWLSENTLLRPLADGWQRWEALFAQAQPLMNSQAKGVAQVSELTKTASTIEESVTKANEELDKATETLEADSEKLKLLGQECAAIDVEKLSREKLALEDGRDQLQTASQLWQRLIETQSQQQKQTSQQQLHAKVLAKSDSDLLEGLQTQPLLERELQIAEESFSLATVAASENAESMRAGLQADKPCPVCGSIEHPYATHTPAMDAVLKGLQDLVKSKRKALRDVESRTVLARAAKASAELSIEQVTLVLTQLDGDSANLNADWSAHSLHAEIDSVPESDRAPWLTERQDGTRRDLEKLNQKEAHYRAKVKLKDAAQAQVNIANTALALAKETLSGLDTNRETTIQALETAQRQLDQIAQQLMAAQSQLDGAFPGQEWRQQWSQNSSAFVSQCRTNANAWIAQQTSVATLNGSLSALQVEISACDKASLQATEQLRRQTESRTAVESELQTYRTDRSALFEGRPVADVEAALSRAIQGTKSALTASQAALLKTQADVTRTLEAVRQTGMLLEQHRTASETAQLGLDAWLMDFNAQSRVLGAETDMVLDGLESLVQIAPEWATAEREALQLLERALTTTQAVLDTRTQSRTAHEADKTVVEKGDALQENLTQIAQAIGSVTETLSNLRLELAKDDERLLASESLRVKIDKQHAISRVWSQLSELIGSADGKKFRNFAQQLTLDILLSYGNQHLQSLTRRYRLQRIKDSLGLLVVDQDMGDEVRSVHSLSGGESFLVSLALALGLASLSSHRVRVESLFIDEGFGSLDADSLSVAMDALDNLQSQGRKVGVISHVQEMTERIGTRVQVQRQAGGLSRISVC